MGKKIGAAYSDSRAAVWTSLWKPPRRVDTAAYAVPTRREASAGQSPALAGLGV
jgi:hypothetical protein